MPVPDEFEQEAMVEAEINFTEETVEQPVIPAAPAQKPVKPIVGIIYPPPEVRNIVDKTASFVARNGPEFETRIRQNEQNNPKFNFLQSGDPYHAYYLHKVKEIQEGKAPAVQQTIAETPELSGLKTTQQLLEEAKKKKQLELLKQVELPFVPKDPPADFEFVADPPSISAHDLDVVKLTAQFVARNGRQFLSTLMTREQRNYQFDFLRPQHSLFQYFTKLLEQYTKVLIPSKDIVKKLEKDDVKKVLDDVKYRANWIRHQEAQKRKEEEEVEKERLAYASIDWHDFVVVETVDYQPFEAGNFPPPTTPQEVGARVLLQDRILQGQMPEKDTTIEDTFAAQDDTEVQDMEEDSDSSSEDEDDANHGQQPIMPGLQPTEKEEVIIKKGYDPKQPKSVSTEKVFTAAVPEEYTISPITGERIPVSQLQEHMRIALLDPRWREQNARQIMERATQESPDAPGPAIYESLKLLAERRSDIFGTGVEETPIGKKAGEERIPGMPWNPNPESSMMEMMSTSSASTAPPVPEEPSEESKKESIGPSVETPVTRAMPPQSQSQPPTTMPQPPLGILNPPVPPMPPMPGIIRSVGGLNLPPPPGQQPPPPPGVMLQSLAGVRPLLGIPQGGFQFNPINPAPPGTLMPRPPLLAPAPPVLPPVQPPPPQPVAPAPTPQPPVEDEPPTKKAKTEDSLIPEAQFLATNQSPVTFTIALPSVPDKPEMNLNGQLISLTMALTEPISVLKSKINEAIGLAPGKQKLRLVEGLFFKDSNTLAFYNVGDNANVHLSLKERGGRKK